MNSSRFRFTIVAGIGLGLTIPFAAAGRARADGFALLVGVNECPSFRLPDGSRPRSLQGAENDALDLADFLVHVQGFPAQNVVVLKGPQATREKIKAAFTRLARRTRPDDQFVFHFSGHGTRVKDVQPFDEPDGLDEALCPWDSNADGEHLIRDDELGIWLEEVPARRVTVILDCCHAGTGTKDPGIAADAETASRYLPIPLSGRRRSASKRPWRELENNTKDLGSQTASFFACRPEQEAFERRFLDQKPPRRAGQFSHFFLEGLRGAAADENRDGIVSNGELLRYTTRRLDESFNQARPTAAVRQNPAMETNLPDAAALFQSRDKLK